MMKIFLDGREVLQTIGLIARHYPAEVSHSHEIIRNLLRQTIEVRLIEQAYVRTNIFFCKN